MDARVVVIMDGSWESLGEMQFPTMALGVFKACTGFSKHSDFRVLGYRGRK
jgi:hypothetical protein